MITFFTFSLIGFIAAFASSEDCRPYTQLKPGVSTYEVDDGGCFFCAKFPQSQFPLEGNDYTHANELAYHCKRKRYFIRYQSYCAYLFCPCFADRPHLFYEFLSDVRC